MRSSTPKKAFFVYFPPRRWGPKPFPAFGVRWKWWNSGGTIGVYRCVSAAISVSPRQSWSYGDTTLSGHHGWEHATRMGTDPESIFCWSWVDLWFLFLKVCGRNTSSFLSQAVKIRQRLIGASQAGKPLSPFLDTCNCKCCIFYGKKFQILPNELEAWRALFQAHIISSNNTWVIGDLIV